MTDPIVGYLGVAFLLFLIGAMGVALRRNAIVAFMCIEMMLNSVNLTFVTLSQLVGNLDGQIAVFFVMVIAAAESAVGLAIILSVFRSVRSIETTDAAQLKW
jgi:NADH-quinone oxidoreductase subunit K